MIHYWSLDDLHLKNAWLTIGSFDGVHRGHQEIVKKLTAGAHAVGSPAVVLTFHPHPSVVLGKRKDPFYLTTPEYRAELLGHLGVDVVIIHPFNPKVASESAREFMDSLNAHLNLQRLCVGHDFALGRGREGNISTLKRIGLETGYELEVIEPFRLDGEVVSSSQIRSLLINGNVAQARELLGHPYRISGEVIHGDDRGHSIGFPTANLAVWSEQVLPKSGVYVCRAIVDGRSLKAVTNVGLRPTFEPQVVTPRVEAYILDFEANLYGKHLHLDFFSRIRDEQRFPNVQALINQINQDVLVAKEVSL